MTAKTLLVATDGSPAAQAAVDEAIELAATMQASVRFVHATPSLAEKLYARFPETGPPAAELAAADPVLAQAAARATARGVTSELEVIGDAGGSANLAATVSGIASGIDASLIVTGSRGRGTVAGAVLGSFSHNLIKQATRPVLVVHAH